MTFLKSVCPLVLCSLATCSAPDAPAGKPERTIIHKAEPGKPGPRPVPIEISRPDVRNLMREGLEADMVVSFWVNERGTVESAKILRTTDGRFSAPVLEAVETWKFTPAYKDGKPVRHRIERPMMFSKSITRQWSVHPTDPDKKSGDWIIRK